ncbi:MAG: hypothetical protein K2W94_07170 [Alphaproteobacteria bacterium]|nr:hypothetical protein [Alphaproteobacteria bacterium]
MFNFTINRFLILIILSLSLIKNSHASDWGTLEWLSLDKIFCGVGGLERGQNLEEVKWDVDNLSEANSVHSTSQPKTKTLAKEEFIDLERGISQDSDPEHKNIQMTIKKADVLLEGDFPHSFPQPTASKPKILEKAASFIKEEEPTQINIFTSHQMAWGEKIYGDLLSTAGIPVASAGAILVYAYPDLSQLLGKVGFGLAALGMMMDKAGSLLLERSRKEAATILFRMRTHAKDITENDLSPKKIKKLSNEFFGMNDRYQSYLGCTSQASRLLGKSMWVAGPAVATSGLILMFTGDLKIGPVLAITGATTFTVGESFKKKADAYEEQLELNETVKKAEQSVKNKNTKRRKNKK